MRLRAKSVASGVEREIRKAAIIGDQTVILGTPVDTGRARANWIVTVGSPAGEADKPADKSGQEAIQQGRAAVQSFKAGLGVRGSIFITNNVEYIVPLENGHSAQAPAGMVQQAIQAMQKYLSRARIM
jgi:hypothetical protein